jgi:2-oxoisovalerate dehydrogenase E1 component alpha subunit
VLFPGALNSEFTNTMEFMHPSRAKAIPTYRVMNQYGEIADRDIGVDTTDEEALQLYRNMVTRPPPPSHLPWTPN